MIGLLPDDARFDHVGYACRELEPQIANLAQLGYAPVGEAFEDPVQGVRGQFLDGGGPCLELLAPLEGSTVLDPWLEGSVPRMYHLAYEVLELEATLGRLTAAGARVLGPPVGAIAFSGRPICFVMLRDARLLVELIEQADPAELLKLL